MNLPIGDPRPASTEGPAGDQRPAGSDAPAGDPRPAADNTPAERTSFDPSSHTATEVHAYLDGVGDTERDRVINAERDGKDRTSITS